MRSTHRNYKVTYDPELDFNVPKRSTSLTLQYEEIIPGRAKDPRTSTDKKSRLYNTSFHIVSYNDSPDDHVLVSNISPLSTESQIMTVLSVYGKVNRVDIIKDPMTGGPLGLARVFFEHGESAKAAVKNGNGRRVVIADAIRIEFDVSGEKLEALLQKTPEVMYNRSLSEDTRKRPSRWGKPETQENKFQSFTKSYTKATIARDAIPFIRGAMEELDRLFRPFGLVDIYHDTYHWYILFDTPDSALEAQQFVHDKNHRVLGYLIELTIPSLDSINHLPHSPKASKPNLSAVHTNHAVKHILYQELADIFLKDIKNRIAGPCIYDFLSPSLVSKKPEPVEKSAVTSAAALESDIVAHALFDPTEDVPHDPRIYRLPRFKRKSHPLDTKQLSNKSEDEDVDIGSGRDDAPHASSEEEEDDFLGTTPAKKQKVVKSKSYEALSDTSVSSDAAKKRKDSKLSSKRKQQRRSSVPKKKAAEESIKQKSKSFCVSSSFDVDVEGDDSDGEKDEFRREMHRKKEESETYIPKQYPAYDPTKLQEMLDHVDDLDPEEALWYRPEPGIELNKEWDPLYQTKDVEDLEYLQVAIIEKVDPNANSTQHALEKLERNEKRMSQSARTRGYYAIPDSVKATYLSKNKALFEPTPGKSVRPNRVNKRRLLVNMVMQNKAMVELDMIKFNQLKQRKKRLRFAKSPIHDWGLYADEHIDANDMVIEYVGEIIRQQVAEERERRYARCGIGSSYLFRIDEDTVIDATRKGSIARFINHCCAPNCSAKIITVDKQKKIVICANRDIEPGEEITYDYKFPIEPDKIPCLCGSKFCKGSLN